jgi:hypothetical protein
MPAVLLLAPFLLLEPLLHRGQGKSTEEPNPKKDSPKVAELAAVQVRFTDDSVLKLTLDDRSIRLKTRYGILLVPVATIRFIDFATRIDPAIARQAETAVAKLGSKQFKVREAATAELRELQEKAFPALLKAAQDKDLEVVRRAAKLLEQLRQQVPADKLTIRPNDVIWTVDSRLTGRILGKAIKALTYQFGVVQLKPGHLRSMQYIGVAPDPGNLEGLRDLVGMSFRFKVTGSLTGPIWGNGVYKSDSPLATVAVHANILKAGETGIVRVTLVTPPGGFGAANLNGVISLPYGQWGGAYQVSR